jgi:hypothetical protein
MGGSRSRQHVISSALRTIMGPYSRDGNGAVMCGLYGVDSYVVSFGSGSSGFKVKLERCSFRKKRDQNSVGWFEIKRVKPMVPSTVPVCMPHVPTTLGVISSSPI